VHKNVERELKLAPPEGFVLPELGGERLPTRIFVSTYHDTPDLRLARHGLTFRHRVEEGTGLWQLKLPRGDARLELERAGPPARPPEELVSLLQAYTRGVALAPVARLRTRREGVRTQGAEIVDDAVAVLDGPRVSRRFRELEVELVGGDEEALRHLERVLRGAGADGGVGKPKLFRALELEPPEEPGLGPETAPGEALAVRLLIEHRRLLTHDPGVRLGDDPEDLHQLRVAARRIRAYLRAARPLLERGPTAELRSELKWLGGALGPARDLDVLLERVRDEAASLDADADQPSRLVESLESLRAVAYASALEALSDARYLALLDRLEEAAAAPPLSGREQPLARLFRKELKRTRRAFAGLGDDSPDEDLHAARIRVKRARYAAELAAHELGSGGEKFVQTAKALQDVLGEHQDAVVAEGRFRAWVETHPEGGVVAGRLIERERYRRAEMRAAWPKLWRKLERRGKKA
jgi:CHAD domain-containing protein